MAEIDDVRSRDTAKRRISELTRQVGDEVRVGEVNEAVWRERQELSRRRLSATLLVVAGAFFIAGCSLLTAGTYDGADVCGTALSNPGWPADSGCHGLVTGYAWGGAASLLVSVGLGLAARLVRWPDLD